MVALKASDAKKAFDSLYEELMHDDGERVRAQETASTTAPKPARALRDLVEDVRVPLSRSERARARVESDEDEKEMMTTTTPTPGRGVSERRSSRRSSAKKSPRMHSGDSNQIENPETLSRFLRQEQRERAVVESRLRELEDDLRAHERDALEKVAEVEREKDEWRERCKQLQRNVPERWLGVFESYDEEIDRLGRENFSLREELHRVLASKLSEESDERRPTPTPTTSGGSAAADGADGEDWVHLRRALRAVTLERDAMAVKLSDVDRRERQMSLVRRHAEGTSRRLARVERLLTEEESRSARAGARADRANAEISAVMAEYEEQLSNAGALIEKLAVRCDGFDFVESERRRFARRGAFK
jgi:hypothetical protein